MEVTFDYRYKEIVVKMGIEPVNDRLKCAALFNFLRVRLKISFLSTEAEDQPDIPPIQWTSSIKYTPVPYEENFDICSKSFIAC